jgi:pimeloyl-ACP methyl ester carboxylesterase
MAKNVSQNPADYIVPLNMNGLQGRMLRLPAPPGKKREILLLYGHHSSLERWWGIAQVLNKYGAVTMPDLPGFGGMDSMYKIGKKPSVDNLADYLAAFLRLRYNKKKVTIIGMSFGFVIATRMLQRYPGLTKKVDLLVSVIGFAHKDDFNIGRTRIFLYKLLTRVFSTRLTASFFRRVCLMPSILRFAYNHTGHAKFEDLTPETAKKMTEVEIWLWHNNDVRTWMYTTIQMLTLDNCKVKVDLPIWHVGMKVDHFFDNHVIEQHLRIIFPEYYGMVLDMPSRAHAPTVIADAKDAAPFIPPKLRRRLAKQEA